MLVSVYHSDPKEVNKTLEQADPDYINEDDYFDEEGFELLKSAMGETGTTIIK